MGLPKVLPVRCEGRSGAVVARDEAVATSATAAHRRGSRGSHIPLPAGGALTWQKGRFRHPYERSGLEFILVNRSGRWSLPCGTFLVKPRYRETTPEWKANTGQLHVRGVRTTP